MSTKDASSKERGAASRSATCCAATSARETGTFDGGPVSVEHAAWAWERYGVEPGRFAAVLVGKYGTVKHRSDKPVEPDGLYALIDEMPMRRREMRERGG